MKLGGKVRDVDSFVDQLKEEGETVTSNVKTSDNKVTAITSQIINTEP